MTNVNDLVEALIDQTFFGGAYAVVAEELSTTSDPLEVLTITAKNSRVIFATEKAEIGSIREALASAELGVRKPRSPEAA